METLILLKPNLIEGLALVGCLIGLVVGIAIIRRSMRPSSWDAPAHRRELKAKKQKDREGLPPGQH